MHRRVPENLPASGFLFGLVLIVYILANAVATQIAQPLGVAVGMVFLDSALYVGFVWILLAGFGRTSRFLQTMSALLGAESLLTISRIPFLVMAGVDSGEVNAPNAGTWLFFLLILWSIDIAGFVLSRALQQSYVVGVMIVLVYAFSSFTLSGLLFPVTS